MLTHFITTPEPGRERDSWFYTYNGLIEPRTVKGIWDGYSEKEMNHDLLLSYGYGDGGGGVNRDMLEQRRRLDKIPGLPHVETTTAGKYFRKLKETGCKDRPLCQYLGWRAVSGISPWYLYQPCA